MRQGEESNEESQGAEEEESSEAPIAEETVCGASSESQGPSEPSHSGKRLPAWSDLIGLHVEITLCDSLISFR